MVALTTLALTQVIASRPDGDLFFISAVMRGLFQSVLYTVIMSKKRKKMNDFSIWRANR